MKLALRALKTAHLGLALPVNWALCSSVSTFDSEWVDFDYSIRSAPLTLSLLDLTLVGLILILWL